MDGTQPIRAPGGQDYGERAELEAQQASAPVPEGGPLGEGVASGASADNVVSLLSSVGSQRPNEDILAGAASPGGGSAPLAPRDVVEGLEYLIQTLDAPSQDLVDLYLRVRAQEVSE